MKSKFLEIISISLILIGYINCLTDPIIANWIKSTGQGYKNYTTNVVKIQYSNDYVYVGTNSIPSFSIGPWASNPNDAKGLDYTFKFPRKPTVNTGTKTTVPLGHIGLWINGVSIYNADDGMSYNNLGIWKRNAYVWEGVSFDSCKGHPDGSSEYHQHISSNCLYSSSSSSHSPLIGFAFDGYPVYGPYGYSSPYDSTSSIKRMETGYRLRSISVRRTLADGTQLSPNQYGPDVSDTYPLKSYLQDYEFVTGKDLDEYNGRWCKTPDYPSGTYAYFIATDSNLDPVYPFIIGPNYYGNVPSGNTGPSSGKVSVSETVTTYYSYSSSIINKCSILLITFSAILNRLF